jgi:tripartite-type tricarboxylate transporter receptor subunit TctC
MPMTANRRSFIAMGLTAAASVLLLAEPAAAEYPERPIAMIVAYPAGGSTDQTARLLATFLQPELGENASIVVENRPGAGATPASGRSRRPSRTATPPVSSTRRRS